MLRGRSCLKECWWGGALEVQVRGQPALIKRYDDSKTKAFRVSQMLFTYAHIMVICTSAMAERRQNASKLLVSPRYH